MSEAQKLIHELLVAAATAHGVHEKEELGGVYDEQWPEWYAAHIERQLAERGLKIVAVETDLVSAD